ncbi:hypothetical protein QQ045_008942 [Rhodiola kirilowii]
MKKKKKMQLVNFIKLPAIVRTNGRGMTQWDQKGRSRIRNIFIYYSFVPNEEGCISCWKINGLQFNYVEDEGFTTLVLSDVFGSISGIGFKLIQLDYPREYITELSIYSNANGLSFKTSLGKLYGQFPEGAMKMGYFDFGNSNQFGGLHGTADRSGICSLGARVLQMASWARKSNRGLVARGS